MDLNKILIQLAQIILAQATHLEHAPEKKIEPGEIAVGTVEDPVTRSLYSFLKHLEQYADDYLTAHKDDRDLAKVEKHSIHASTLARLIEVVAGAFWHRIHEQFDATNNTGLTTSVREGWQVVVWKSSSESRTKTHVIDLGVVDLRSLLATKKE